MKRLLKKKIQINKKYNHLMKLYKNNNKLFKIKNLLFNKVKYKIKKLYNKKSY